MDTVASVFEEILTWQQAPCEELRVGFLGKTGNATKRIMLYGVTQVGKTTLLMNMMGVLPQKQEKLKQILRGGARTGNSATSTAVIYNKWDQEQFGLAVTTIDEDAPEAPETLTEKAFAARITELNQKNRSAMSHSGSDYKDIFHYYIPSHYFESDDDGGETVQYIDLPGFGEKNEAMCERADELITKCASRVDGAIVVLKANNIIKILQDYADFISRIPQKRLTFAVTHAVKECIEVKTLAEKYTSVKEDEEESLWMEIADTHRGLLLDTCREQIDASATGLDDISAFPVELDSYLEDFYPQLRGVFRHSRHYLREHIQKIPSKNTFSACEEMLDLQIDLAEIKSLELENKVIQIQKQLQATANLQNELENQQQEVAGKLSPVEMQISDRKKLVRRFSDAINRLDGENLLSGHYVKNSLIDMVLMNSTEKNNYLTRHMLDNLEEWLSTESSDKEFAELRSKLMSIATKKICTVDTDDLLIKRDGFLFKKFGEESESYVDSYMSQKAEEIKKQMRKELKNWEDRHLRKATDEKEKLTRNQAQLTLVVQELKAQTRQQKAESTEITRKIKENQKRIQLLKKNRSNIRSVFVKHFYLKKKEMEQRIAAANDPAVKTALLLALSTIYRNMKHHIEEEERQA